MVIDKDYIQKLRENGANISKKQEQEIFDLFGKEPDDFHEWTEQDIYEQIRKMLQK